MYDDELKRQMGKAVKEYSDIMCEIAEAEEAGGKLIMRSPLKDLGLRVGIGGKYFLQVA